MGICRNLIVISWLGMWHFCEISTFLTQARSQTTERELPAATIVASQKSKLEAKDASGDEVPLPEPPEDLAVWIRSGEVRFEFYSPGNKPRSFDGETQFEYRYDYRCRSDWKQTRVDGKPGLEIHVSYSDVKLEMKHLILLPQKMIHNVFDQPLTRHEFDHVRISAQPDLEKVLRSMLVRRNSTIRHVLDADSDEFKGTPTEADLERISQAVISNQSNLVFEDFAELIKIRYRELDRISRYGIEPLSDEDRKRIIDSPIKAEAPTNAAKSGK